METKSLPCFVSPKYMKGFEVANNDGPDSWAMFESESPPIDELVWIIDKAGAVGFGCRREYGMFAMCFKDPTPVAWKKRTIGAPGMKFE
ncbi:MAG: hypothetical protein AAB451_01620 [Patescibacteria group bacterium]